MNLVPPLGVKKQNHPFRLENWQLRCISLALLESWNRALAHNPNLLEQDEPIITIEICESLASVQADETIEGFTQETFDTTVPNPQRKSAPKSVYKTRFNDFIVRPSGYFSGGNKLKYGLVVECKRLIKEKCEIDSYIIDGMSRFVHDGDYAEYMEHAMMLGYSDGFYKLPNSLIEKFNTSRSKKIKSCIPEDTTSICHERNKCEITVTKHNRYFILPDSSIPGPVSLHHLWLENSTRAHEQ